MVLVFLNLTFKYNKHNKIRSFFLHFNGEILEFNNINNKTHYVRTKKNNNQIKDKQKKRKNWKKITCFFIFIIIYQSIL